MTAPKIELYLKPSGDELDRMEAYESVDFRDQNRKIKGTRLTYTTGDRLEAQLSASGTWTVVIEDYLNDTAGGYTLSLMNVSTGPLTSVTDTDGGPITSNEIRNGTFQDGVDFDAYTFSAFAGNRVLISAITTGGSANTTLTLYPTAGGNVDDAGTTALPLVALEAATAQMRVTLRKHDRNSPLCASDIDERLVLGPRKFFSYRMCRAEADA
jgi:hypothetical protein